MLLRKAVMIGLCVVFAGFAVFWGIRMRPETLSLRIAGGEPGGNYQAVATVIGAVFHDSESRIRINALPPTRGSAENARLVSLGEADLALVQNDTPGNGDLRTIAVLYEEVLHFLVSPQAEIETIHDLRGKRVALGMAGSGSEQVAARVFAHFGMSEADFTAVHQPLETSAAALAAGEVDALLTVGALGNPICADLIRAGHAQFVSLGQPGDPGSPVAGLLHAYPFAKPFTVPQWAYPAPTSPNKGEPAEAAGTIAVQAVLVGRRSLTIDTVKSILATLHESRLRLAREAPILDQTVVSELTGRLQFPLHPGAFAFVNRDEPSFIVEYADVMGFLLSVVLFLYGFFTGLQQILKQRIKDALDVYYIKIENIMQEVVMQDPGIERLEQLVIELNNLRYETVNQLVNEKLLADESYRIFQAMVQDCQQLLDRHIDTASRPNGWSPPA